MDGSSVGSLIRLKLVRAAIKWRLGAGGFTAKMSHL